MNSPSPRNSYVCKRVEEEKSLCLIADKEDEVSLTPIQLVSYSTEVEGRVV